MTYNSYPMFINGNCLTTAVFVSVHYGVGALILN